MDYARIPVSCYLPPFTSLNKNGHSWSIRLIERVTRLELVLGPWKGHVLPLHHTRMF